MFSVIALYVVFGSTFALSKLLLEHATPLCAVGTRMLFGGTLLLGYVYALYRTIPYQKKDFWYYVQLTIFNVIVPYSLRLWSMQYISSVKAALLFNISPFLTAFFAYLIYKERMTRRQLMGLIIGVFGTAPILWTTTGPEVGIASDSFVSLAELAALVSTASISYSLIVMQRLVRNNHCPVALANGISMFFGGIITLVLAFFFESTLVITTVSSLSFYALLQTLVINIGCANVRAHFLKTYSSTFMSFSALLAPLSATLYGWLFFSEELSWNFALSFALVFLGLAIYYSDEIKNES